MQQPLDNPAHNRHDGEPGEDDRIRDHLRQRPVAGPAVPAFLSRALLVGAGLVVLAGLAFNLVPLCTPGRPLRSLVKGALIIVVIFIVVTLLALGSALLYSWYLTVR